MDQDRPVSLAQPPRLFWQDRKLAWAFLRSGVTRTGLIGIGIVLAVGCTVALIWRDLVSFDEPFDPLLAGLWVFMTLMLAWRVRVREDLILAFVGVCGGFLIEWWGTTTELWTYFTHERPPLWIIPAWPVAALATDRLTFIADSAIPRVSPWVFRVGYALALPAFLVAMIRFMQPAIHISSCHVVIGIMVVVLLSCRAARRDLLLFFVGTALGWLLEYWGTTRHCWTYYTHQTPPLVTAFAHGFASVAFGRAFTFGHWVLRRPLGLTQQPGSGNEPPWPNASSPC